MQIFLLEPRGFCAGVRRAVEIVERAIAKFGIPIYVKHEIVHNKFVIDDFKNRGVIFTDDLSIIPEGSVLIYSAHGVSNAIELQAKNLKLISIDATCPLVKKVHREVTFYEERGYDIILIGHKNHPEIEGTAGKLSKPVILVQTLEDVEKIFIENPQTPVMVYDDIYKQSIKNPEKVAITTQTTLSIDDTKAIIEALVRRFPALQENIKNDICYATQNRQDAVKNSIKNHNITHLVVVGAKNSSNSNRLRDIGERSGIKSFLINSEQELTLSDFTTQSKVGITAGASAPEVLVERVINFFKQNFQDIKVNLVEGVKEDTVFFLPKEVR